MTTLVRAVWLLSIAVVVFLSLDPNPGIETSFSYQDKVHHFLAYFWLAFLPYCSFQNKTGILISVLAMFLLGVLIEILQLQIAGRFFSFPDILANGAGILVGAGFGSSTRSRIRKDKKR
ncbi:MAG: VanZ family protein [Desulfovibrionales bacterium]